MKVFLLSITLLSLVSFSLIGAEAKTKAPSVKDSPPPRLNSNLLQKKMEVCFFSVGRWSISKHTPLQSKIFYAY